MLSTEPSRCLGSRLSSFSMTDWHSGLICGNFGCVLITFLYTSLMVSPQKGGRPATISKSTQPSDHQSTSYEYVLRSQISGAR